MYMIMSFHVQSILHVCNQTKGKFSTFDYDFAPRDSIIVKFSDLWYRKLCVSINIYMYIMILLNYFPLLF